MIAILFILNVGKIFNADFGLFWNVPMQNGTLTEARINESVLRILTVKAHFGILTEVPPAAESGG